MHNGLYIDFVNQYIQKQPLSFKKEVISKNPNVIKTKILIKFHLILLPVLFQEKEYLVIFDTGSSLTTLNLVGNAGTNLIDKKSFTDTTAVNSWGKKLLIYGKKTNESIKISGFPIPLKTIQFTDPASKIAQSFNELNQELQEDEKLPYVIGIIGNKLFFNRQILIDYQEQMFYIF